MLNRTLLGLFFMLCTESLVANCHNNGEYFMAFMCGYFSEKSEELLFTSGRDFNKDTPFIFSGIACLASSKQWDCAKDALARSLSYWDMIVDTEKERLIDEISTSLKNDSTESFHGRGNDDIVLTDIIDSALSDVDVISTSLSNDVDGKVDDEKDSTEKVELTETEEARGKKKKKGSYYNRDDYYGYYRGKGKGGKGKKKKGYMKLFMVGAALKAKLEMLLKLLSFHLQLKFFAIAAIGLIVNIARFWLDVKKGQAPQKVIYYEHAQHQHHYDEHGGGGDDWNGGYWKRSNDPVPYINSYGDLKA